MFLYFHSYCYGISAKFFYIVLISKLIFLCTCVNAAHVHAGYIIRKPGLELSKRTGHGRTQGECYGSAQNDCSHSLGQESHLQLFSGNEKESCTVVRILTKCSETEARTRL